MTDRTAGPAVPLRRTPARPAAAPPDIAQAIPAGAVPGGLGSRSIPAPAASNKLAQQKESGDDEPESPTRPPRRFKRGDAERWRWQHLWVQDRGDAPRLAELRRVAALIDRPEIRRRDFDRLARISSDALLRRFGSWRAALARAGLQHRYSGRPITRAMRAKPGRGLTADQLLDLLRRSATRKGVVTLARLRRKFGVSVDPYRRQFGSWQEAVRRAGLQHSSYARDPEMLAALCGRKSTIVDGGGKKPKAARAREKPEESRFIPVGLRFRVLKRDDYRCALCGDSPAISKGTTLEVDHIHPFSKGGRTTEANLRTLCRRCNQGKGARHAE